MAVSQGLRDCHAAIGGTIAVGTACSGTDVVLDCIERLIAIWKERFGVEFKLRPKFSCENVEYKQKYIQEVQSPENLFPDIEKLGDSVVANLEGDSVSDLMVLLFVCGIECDSISGLNRGRGENFDCARQSDASRPTRTGSTA